ncbi:putative signal peptidase II [Ahrensia sp. R2A130]|nr:putative signal peptidase II [Ahrensia sp. R2A130]
MIWNWGAVHGVTIPVFAAIDRSFLLFALIIQHHGSTETAQALKLCDNADYVCKRWLRGIWVVQNCKWFWPSVKTLDRILCTGSSALISPMMEMGIENP